MGGDAYAALDTPHGPRALIADVRGKGLPAISTAALVLAAFREAAHDEPDLTTVAGRLDTSLRRHLTHPDDFVTATLVALPHHTPGTLEIVNLGHPPPLHVDHRTHAVTALDPPRPAPPLGLLDLAPSAPVPHTAPFRTGDRLLLYTDGITEARDPDGRFFRLARHLAESLHPDPRTTLTTLHRHHLLHTRHPHDDSALLLLQHTGPDPADTDGVRRRAAVGPEPDRRRA
ncbi:PP2C family protein-serine/threonine phosphatase [Streptomyces sp. NPDC091025]|uniref:PP2C family protein-serine/threonine phosphatase n=1 Tax=Streptomyces sp. NPDC091025 TaxID=3365970 RepID=UPI003820FEBC